MEEQFHKLLARQIKKHLGSVDNIPEEVSALIHDINNTYVYHDDDILLLQNSVEISSSELRQAFHQQKADAEKQKGIIEKINEIISAIKPTSTSVINKDKHYDTNILLTKLLELIEERKKSEKEILKLSFAIEQNPACVIITDLDGKIEYVNPKFTEFTGYSQKDVIGKNPSILKSGHTSAEEYRNLWKTISEGREWRGEFLNKKKNGDLYWEKALISPVKNLNGETINYLALKEDFTEQKVIAETLENERTLFRTIIDLIPDAVYVKDLDGKKILSNPTDVKFSGKISEEEVLGKTDFDLFHSNQAMDARKEEISVITSGKPILNAEGIFIDASDVEHSVLISKVPLYDFQGNIKGIVGITNDISVIKQAETALQRAHKSLSDVLNAAMHTSIIATDTNGIITIFSHGAEKMLGYTSSEMVGLQTTEVLHLKSEVEQYGMKLTKENGEEIKGFEVFVHKARQRQHEERNWTFIRKDGSMLTVNLIVTAIRNTNDEITGFLGIAHDITLQKEYEEKLLTARSEAENANKAKSEFLANVSHEIRTPMNAVIGFAEILLDKLNEPIHKEHVKAILSSGRTLLSLINDILDLSKIEAGKLEIEYEPVHFSSVIRDIQQVFTPKVKLKPINFEVIVGDNTPEYIYMDQVRLNQILFNLVGNAIKFTDKGYVKLTTSVEDGEHPERVNLYIEIEDTGIGIPKDQINPIFEAFTQQSGQSNRKYEGTGLGLAISKRLAEKMDGTIWVESEIGKGSLFKVCFRNVQLAQAFESNDLTDNAEIAGISFEEATVMIVDDIDFNIQILKSMLDAFNFRFIEVFSGEEAIEILKTESVDIIFMDFRMQGMSGIATTEIIKNTEHTSHIPVIAFTASAMKSQEEEIKELFDGFIRKPVDKKTLIMELKKYLPHHFSQPVEVDVHSPIDHEEICNISPEIMNEIETLLIPQWESISGNLIIFEIEEFCDQLESMNQKYHCNIFPNYGNKLRHALQTFDVDKISKTLAEFGSMIDVIKKHQKD